MAEFNSYLLGKARKSVGNLTIVYAKGKKHRTGESVPAVSFRLSVKVSQEWVTGRLTMLSCRPI